VPGEAIVHFKAGGAAGQLVTRATGGDADATGRLDAFLTSLSSELALPVKRKRIGSGGDVVLALDLPELASRLLTHVRADPRVTRAMFLEDGSEVGVELKAGSAEAREVERRPPGKPSRVLSELAESLARAFGFPVTGRVSEKRQLVLAVDARALTLRLVERLRAHPDVEYAETNRVLRKLGTDTGPAREPQRSLAALILLPRGPGSLGRVLCKPPMPRSISTLPTWASRPSAYLRTSSGLFSSRRSPLARSQVSARSSRFR